MGDLLRSPSLHLRVLAGANGLDRRVSWAHVSELEDPTPWLLGAELIMSTGIAIPRSAARQVAYLERLDDAGVAGLALSAKLLVPPLHEAFLGAADSRRFPVLEVPLPVPFIAIAQAVAAVVQADVGYALTAQLQVFDSIRWLTAEGLQPAEVFVRLEALSGFDLFLCDADRRPLLPGVPAPPGQFADLMPESPDGPPAVAGGYVLPVPTPGEPAGVLLAIRRPGIRTAELAVVQHIATVAALQVTIARHEQETLRREGAETLAEYLGGVLEGQAARRRLARSGFDPDVQLQLFALRITSTADADITLDRRLTNRAIPHVILRQERQSLILLPGLAEIRIVMSEGASEIVGASRMFEAGAPLDLPRREALWAAARSADAGGGLVEYGADAAGRWLAEDAKALRALTLDVLGAALTYDLSHSSALVATVRTWMERDRRADDAARALGIHPNTLAYRLGRFEKITGHSLASTADLAEIWLALRASEQVGD